MSIEGFTISNHVYVPERVMPDSLFERKYTTLRFKEKRMYSDEEVLRLPSIAEEHPHYREWILRKDSCNRLVNYLERKKTPLKILEVGCGNGWLSHQLKKIPGSVVIGSDINFTELQQAARVFHEVSGLHFMYGDVESGLFEKQQFDIIVFAACIQYFSPVVHIIREVYQLLKPSGEIHILDSPFYKPREASFARQRTVSYYNQIGFPEMASRYFHHTLEDLQGFPYAILYKPGWFGRYVLRNANPFPWLCIKKPNLPS